MRIAVTADLHYDLGRESARDQLEAVRRAVTEADPDVLVFAGDQVGLGKKHLPALLESYRGLRARKLIVPGNHDLWLPEGDSRAYYLATLPQIYADHGFHMLDAEPVVVDGVGFAGGISWYDYSFRDPTVVLGKGESYEASRFRGHVVANDKIFVRLGRSDPEFCREQLERLEGQVASLTPRVDRVIAVTHMAAFADLLPPPKKEDDRFMRAFHGSAALGEMLLRHPQVTHHFHGHIHHLARVKKGGLESVSVGCTYRTKRVEIVDL